MRILRETVSTSVDNSVLSTAMKKSHRLDVAYCAPIAALRATSIGTMLRAGGVLGSATAGFGAVLWRFVSEAIVTQADESVHTQDQNTRIIQFALCS